MGLDTVELVMEVEERFGITIGDRDAEKIVTVGMLHRYILAKIGRPDVRVGPAPCLSSFAFYRVRRALIDRLGIDRRSIRPDAAMAGLMSCWPRREAWQKLREALGWRLPPLVRPSWMVEALYVLGSLAWAAGIVVGLRHGTILDAAVWLIVGFPALAIAAALLTRPFATRFPAGAVDLRSLIHSALDLNPWTIRRQAGLPVAEGDVWDALVALISEQLGVPPDMLKEDSSFVGDLGMG